VINSGYKNSETSRYKNSKAVLISESRFNWWASSEYQGEGYMRAEWRESYMRAEWRKSERSICICNS